jgi:hypothetical protein
MIHRASACMLFALMCTSAVAAAAQPCTSEPRSKWLERESVRVQVEALGYKVIEIEVENGCYAVEVRDKNGKELDLFIDPVSGKIVRQEEDA